MFRQWVGEGGNSDHFPIFLELSKLPRKPAAPFKFNATWLQEESYEKLFKETWIHPDGRSQEGKGFLFMENLKKLKKATIEWAKSRRERQKEDLVLINEELQRMECTETDGYRSQESKEKILLLEKQRDQILLSKEEEWRLKSRAIWLKAGDENTKFFHNYAKGRKNANTIWKLKNEEGEEANTFEELSLLGRNHFQSLFADQGEITLAEIIRTAQCFPRYVEDEEAESLMYEVSKEEVESVIKSMAKDKSPGPDGRTIELFQHFFEQIGTELTEVVEESRRKGEVYSPFNTTFIALIPKKENPDSFEDFRPISLCNCIYKIIAKLIAVRIKPILSRCITNEQFGFLDGRQIHEAIGVAQETIHSVKKMKRKGAVIKIDLSKAYDRINWVYIRMLLTHLGFKYEFIRWIMGCISNVNFAILINGAATPFFKSFRGLRQGCPLSPLLFLLVAEGLSHLIRSAKREGAVKGLEVAVNMFITHLLFVDDILLFTNGSLNEIKELKNILDLFMKATGMQINYRKSQLITEGLNRNEKNQISVLLPFEVHSMENPFKYLGFWLKPNAYRNQDWNWLVAKTESRISQWSYKWLSRAGRLTLIKSVLLAMPVYWAALTWVPKGILRKINRICSRFLWAGSKEESVLPWVAWDKIARPKEWGGWGIKNLTDFSTSLAAKSGWRIIKMENLWTKVVKRKYIDPTPLEEWIRKESKKEKNGSVVWKATVEAFKVIEQGLAWQIGNGENLKIGKDPWVGCNEKYALSPGLIRHLESKGIRHLSQVEKIGFSTIWGQAWKSGEELGLRPAWWNEWKVFTEELTRSNVRLRDRQDQLVWAHAENGSYSPKFGYKFLMNRKGWGEPEWWDKLIWKLKCPAKARLFFWCILKRKIPTWDLLQARYKQGPGRCSLCKSDSENISHIFLACPFVKTVWAEVGKLIGKRIEWEGRNVQEVWEKWWRNYPGWKMRNLPPIICWGIWIARNRSIFMEKETTAESIAIQSSAILESIPDSEEGSNTRQIREEQIREGIPWAYFDGASQNNTAGAGMIIHLSKTKSLKASVGLGTGTNNYAELSALKLLLCWLIHRHILTVQIFGDSLSVVNWVNGQSRCHSYMLRPLLEEIMSLKSSFNVFSIGHIYRERNGTADTLSKEGLQQAMGSWKVVEEDQGQIRVSDQPPCT